MIFFSLQGRVDVAGHCEEGEMVQCSSARVHTETDAETKNLFWCLLMHVLISTCDKEDSWAHEQEQHLKDYPLTRNALSYVMIIFIFSKSADIFSSEWTTAGTMVVIIFIVYCWLYFWLIY